MSGWSGSGEVVSWAVGLWFGDRSVRASMKFPVSRLLGERGTCRVREMS